ncbi:MAG: molybdate ABC transporter substrate-binding protein [Planctomycetota bacterium]|nr:molybdate ABC transporter substrate-binding protein [Planctomycetota bacterium]MDE1889573.1 molybdate ABC transporter substrate-binding protein [Planctomycetota bacterium]MDE2217227.1 molybdate ABC transporter substrate-binding protein [Planctomycetota bacterium]
MMICFSNKVRADEKILVAAAANLTHAMDEICKDFEKENPTIDVEISYGSSGNFFAQIKQGAPFDIFFSADTTYPERLEEEGLTVKGERKIYAMGSIVFWIPKNSSLNPRKGLHLVLDPKVKKLAIANQRLAPYGMAAEEALRYYGLWDKVQDKLVFGENISQTAQFVQAGAADVGIIALSQAISPKMEGDGDYWIIPPETYNKLEQAYVVLQRGRDKPGIRKFLEFVQGKKGGKIFSQYGYSLPK